VLSVRADDFHMFASEFEIHHNGKTYEGDLGSRKANLFLAA
jgi:hypothetical protein